MFVYAQSTPFNRGVNLTSWFQVGSAQEIQFSKYSKKDFEQIKSLGSDMVRLPINLHFMTNGEPDYILDPLFLNFLDQVVDWCEALEIHLILDNHTFDVDANTDPGIGRILNKVWRQMADHYKERSTYLYYEVLNEPHGIADSTWNRIQIGVVNAIREVDQKHTIIVGGAGWNSYNNLAPMPIYEDDNLIYTFHFYDPFIFTHQGASWVNPSMEPVNSIPFPYEASQMPGFPSSLRGSWVEANYITYPIQGNAAHIHSLLNRAIQFRESRGVPIYCGELGVYIPNSNNEDRVRWYQVVREYLEANNIAWTSWDYQGGFGLFEANGQDLFEHNLNIPLLEALDFNIPPQSEYLKKPDSVGYDIYRDFVGEHHFESSFSNGLISYYAEDSPNNGEYCLSWTGADRYNTIGFEIKPLKDLTQLRDEGYALDFMIRSTAPVQLDIRFMDTKTGPNDRPWRMRTTLGPGMVNGDRKWQHFHIPLANFSEGGAWDNAWYEPQGLFDWTNIDRLEIVAEYSPFGDTKVWFDNLHISNQDTAQIFDTSVFDENAVSSPIELDPDQFNIYPNPANTYIKVSSLFPDILSVDLMDQTGRILLKKEFHHQLEIDLSSYSKGIYLLRIKDKQGRRLIKRILRE